MTLAEMLMVVAIIIILGGVAVISLIRYQELLALRERDSIAKQLFIAAQNHLTVAKGEGYLAVTLEENMSDAKKAEVLGIDKSNTEGVSYIFVQSQSSHSFKGGNGTILDQMLPAGSIDENVRAGNYIIRYQPETAKVLDVFYCSRGSGKFDRDLTASDYEDALAVRDDKEARKNFGGRNKMLGYYGGADLDPTPVSMRAPAIEVDNGEQLTVTVRESNRKISGSQMCLMIRGVQSEGELAVILNSTVTRCISADEMNGVYTYVIDDISTEGMHFCQLDSQNGKDFIAGEDLMVSAAAFNNTKLSTIARSEEKKTNSLYQSIAENAKAEDNDPKSYTAFISRCRHLENLEEDVSNTGRKDGSSSGSKDILLTAAAQTEDLEWSSGRNVYSKNGTLTQAGSYWPVSYNTALIYDGLRHSIKGISTSGHAAAGVFGVVETHSGIKDLKLINCAVSGTDNAGTLAGSTTGTNIENVIAYVEPVAGQTIRTTRANHVVRGTNAGGLVGSMNGGNIRYSAAAMPVIAGTCAGGLVGETSGGVTIRTSYSGGYTENGIYNLGTTGGYNVQSGGTAGGLVGSAADTNFKWCYSTCSVDGSSDTNTGGFAGTVSGSIVSCYCTGRVGGTNSDEEVSKGNNAFSGSGGTISGNNYYYEMVNDYENGGNIGYKGSGFGNSTAIVSIDDSEDVYNAFVSGEGTWNGSVPYDSYLASHYRNNGEPAYPLMTVTQLMAADKANIPGSSTDIGKYFVNTHYGDWPSPEMFFVNSPQ